MTPGMYCGPVDHDWQADPDHRGEGCICTLCGVTEAELDAMENGLHGTYDELPF